MCYSSKTWISLLTGLSPACLRVMTRFDDLDFNKIVNILDLGGRLIVVQCPSSEINTSVISLSGALRVSG